jgi:hypothetical protein
MIRDYVVKAEFTEKKTLLVFRFGSATKRDAKIQMCSMWLPSQLYYYFQ